MATVYMCDRCRAEGAVHFHDVQWKRQGSPTLVISLRVTQLTGAASNRDKHLDLCGACMRDIIWNGYLGRSVPGRTEQAS